MHPIEDAVQPIQTNDAIGSQRTNEQLLPNFFFRDEQANERLNELNEKERPTNYCSSS